MCPITLVEQHGQDHQIPTTRTPSQIPGAGDGALLDAAPTAQILDDRCNPSRRNRGVFGEPVRLARFQAGAPRNDFWNRIRDRWRHHPSRWSHEDPTFGSGRTGNV